MGRIVKWVLLPLLLIFVVVAGYFSVTLFHFLSSISQPSSAAHGNTGTSGDPSADSMKNSGKNKLLEWNGKDRVNILIMGGDSRGASLNGIQRSDSIMIASLDPKTKTATLMSVLRDTYVNIPGHGMNRINAAFAFGGPTLAKQTVSNLLGIPIQYYVYTDFEGFIKLVDALGGINMNVPKNMTWTDSADGHKFDIKLTKGYQHLDGKTALEFVRFRHDNESDYGRTKRQREFLKQLAEKMQTPKTLIKLPNILNQIQPYITTDMSVSDMIKLGSLAYKCKASTIDTQQIPPMKLLQNETVTMGDGTPAEVLTTDPVKLRSFVREFLQKQDATTDQGTAGANQDMAASSTAEAS